MGSVISLYLAHYHGDTFSFYILVLIAQSQLIYDFKSFFHKYMYPMHSNDCFPNAHCSVLCGKYFDVYIIYCIYCRCQWPTRKPLLLWSLSTFYFGYVLYVSFFFFNWGYFCTTVNVSYNFCKQCIRIKKSESESNSTQFQIPCFLKLKIISLGFVNQSVTNGHISNSR